MLNFERVKEIFQEEAIDILRYETWYWDNETVFRNFVDRMSKYINREWEKYNPDFRYWRSNNSDIIGFEIVFDSYELPFGFELSFNTDVMRRLRYTF